MNAPLLDVRADRRDFLGGSALVLGLALPMPGARAAAAATSGESAVFAPNAFVRIDADSIVTVIIKHIEFGQGPATGLATIVAEELDADWAQMRMAFSPANDALYKNLFFGTMGTGGSTAIANSWMQMRAAGASARAMLVEAAARRWKVPAAEVKVTRGVISHGKRKARFGELVADAMALPVPEKPALKPVEQFTLIGTDLPKLDTAGKTNGSAQFTMDINLPGTVHSAILHPPAFGGTVKAVDDAAALAVPGVKAVKVVPRGVAVIADSFYAAQKGRAALKVEWDLASAERRSSEAMHRLYAEAAKQPGTVVKGDTRGDIAQALAGAAKKVEATYHFPFLAHAPMEPLDAVIHAKDGRLDVWMGSQMQTGELSTIAQVMGVAPDKAVLHQQFAGGSFGRRAEPDNGFAAEAASIAKAWGRPDPVKHVWTRENDIRGGRYRPLVVHRLSAGLDAAGNITGWDQVVVAQSFMLGTPMAELFKMTVDNSLFEGNGAENYAVPNARLSYHVMPNGVPTLWWRSVGHTHTAYANETFVDELLEAGGKDRVEGRLALLKQARSKAVLARAAEMAGWGKPRSGDSALGVAVHNSFGSFVAQVAEVRRGKDGLPHVSKVWCAVDCGIAVNPNIIRAQMESGIGYGLGHALYAEINIEEGGRVVESNFDRYRSLRIGEMPAVEVAIIKSTANPTGVGEPGLPPIAPAVANAWRALTGKKVHRLPFAHPENAGKLGDMA